MCFSNLELVFYRSFLGLLMVYALTRQQRGSLATPHLSGHLWRSISGSIALLLFFYCITVLSLDSAVTLNYTSPLFLTLLTFHDWIAPGFVEAIWFKSGRRSGL